MGDMKESFSGMFEMEIREIKYSRQKVDASGTTILLIRSGLEIRIGILEYSLNFKIISFSILKTKFQTISTPMKRLFNF